MIPKQTFWNGAHALRKKRKNLTKTAIAILLLVLGASMSMCCCGEHDSERYCETTIVAIKGKLREIYKESLTSRIHFRTRT